MNKVVKEFTLRQSLDMIKSILDNNTNTCEYEYLLKLQKDVEEHLAQLLQEDKCEFCKNPCGNEHCPVITRNKK